MVERCCSSSRVSCGDRLLLRWDGTAQNSFPTKQRKDPSSRATRRKRGSSGCGRDPPSCFLSKGDGYVGELLELQQGVKELLEVPELRCD